MAVDIILDAGHGGFDNGATYRGRAEKASHFQCWYGNTSDRCSDYGQPDPLFRLAVSDDGQLLS